MTTKPKVIGEGTYGCVHKPALTCKNRSNIKDDNIVSKLMKDKNAKEEMTEFKLMNKADEELKFHLGKPKSCKVENNIENHIAIRECSGFNSDLIDEYSLLLLKDGGLNLEQFAKYIKTLNFLKKEDVEIVEKFWLEVTRVLYGIMIMNKKGIIHHDLKHLNIVYNKDKTRINLIDFGLMTTRKKVVDASTKSKYSFAINHWSFPVEMKLYNKTIFNWIAKANDKSQMKYVSENAYEFTDQHRYIFECILDDNEKNNYQESVNKRFNHYYQMIKGLTVNQYNLFLDKAIDTVDTYGAASGLIYVLKHSRKMLPKMLYYELKDLFDNMLHFNVFIRDSPEEVLSRYENILLKYDLLKKYNKKIVNHIVVDGSPEIVIDNNVKEQSNKQFLDTLIKKCPEGKEHNPKTNRCVNVCKEGFERNDQFLCRKKKTQKNTRKRCPNGTKKNKITGKCDPITK